MSTDTPSDVAGLDRHLSPLMERIEALLADTSHNEHHIGTYRTGIRGLDALIGGFHGGDLVVVAARPSMGKSALLREFVTSLSIDQQIPTALYSLDASPETTATRLLASEARVDMRAIREGKLTEEEMARIARTAGI